MNARTRARPAALAVALALPALVAIPACYSAQFDENQADVYYCSADTDCLTTQACAQFRCVSDLGPKLRLQLPEPLTLIDSSTLTVDFDPTDFEISDSNEAIEGQGKVRIRIDGGLLEQTVVTDGQIVDISSLDPGAHRVDIQAVYGDGTLYPNPSAFAYTTFFVEDSVPSRPQIALVYPPPGYVHVVGEDLQIRVAVRNFALGDSGNDCKVPSDCDPFDPLDLTCIPICESAPSGHAHIYLESDYPGCLLDAPIGCNGDYVLSMRTADVNDSGNEVTGTVEANTFDAAGTMLLSVGMQYNDHEPYPAKSFVIHDSIEITVVER